MDAALARMDAELDAGDILVQRAVPIGPNDTAPQLVESGMELIPEVLTEALDALEAGTASFTVQDHDAATHAAKLTTAEARIDWTRPVLWLFAALLVLLILLPLSWLAVFAFTDKNRHPTLANFVTLFSNPDFLDPLLTTAIIATTSAVICCIVAAPISWLVSRTDMPGRTWPNSRSGSCAVSS